MARSDREYRSRGGVTRWTFFSIILVVLVIVGVPWLLITQASDGSVVAGVVLGAVVTAVFIGIGFGGAMIQSRAMADRENDRFVKNVQENLAMMQSTQRVQASLAQSALDTASRVAPQLPPPSTDSFVIPDDIFDRLN